MNLQRLPDWENRLNDYVVSKRNEPFAWGTNDCVSYVIGAIKAMTGYDFTKELPLWDDEQSSEDVIQVLGEGSLYKAIRAFLGKPVRGAHGRKGDIAFYQGCCGIVLGPYAMFFGENGYVFVSITRVQRAFRVG